MISAYFPLPALHTNNPYVEAGLPGVSCVRGLASTLPSPNNTNYSFCGQKEKILVCQDYSRSAGGELVTTSGAPFMLTSLEEKQLLEGLTSANSLNSLAVTNSSGEYPTNQFLEAEAEAKPKTKKTLWYQQKNTQPTTKTT